MPEITNIKSNSKEYGKLCVHPPFTCTDPLVNKPSMLFVTNCYLVFVFERLFINVLPFITFLMRLVLGTEASYW